MSISLPYSSWHLGVILSFNWAFCAEEMLAWSSANFCLSLTFSSFSLVWACMHIHTQFPKHLWFFSQINRAFKLQWSRKNSLFISLHILTQVAVLVNCFDLMLVPFIKFALPTAIHKVKALLLWTRAEQNSGKQVKGVKKRLKVNILSQIFSSSYPCS